MRSVVQDIFPLAGLDGLCWPRGIDECTLFFNERFLGHEDYIEIQHGSYMTLHHTTFQLRYSMYLPRFPRAPQFVRDFLWRCRHFGIEDYNIHAHFTEEGLRKDTIPGSWLGTVTIAEIFQVYSTRLLRNGPLLALMIGVSLSWWRLNQVFRQISLLFRSS